MYPGAFFLSADVPAVASYLAAKNWLAAHEVVERLARAGEGNMNCVLRVFTSERTFILKQSRPWVEKYPSIPAPWDRALIEARFYREVEAQPAVAAFLPKLLSFDPEERLLMLEDLGQGEYFEYHEADLEQLIDLLLALHSAFRGPERADAFSNYEMRALNHEHIFALPMRRENGLDLDSITPGLSGLAHRLQSDPEFSIRVRSLGERYLDASAGTCLLHGDYFPGSWLKAGQRVYVIDPEFCFYGAPEWDLGVMAAHLYFAGLSNAFVEGLLSRYTKVTPVDSSLVFQFAGVEIMRRLIGVAQLPADFSLERKMDLLNLSHSLVLDGEPT